MTVRTCASCGATVGALTDRCPSCGADPDLRMLSIGPATGPTRPRSTSRRRQGRWWVPVVAAVALVWSVLVLTGAPDDGDGKAASRPAATPTTAAVPAPVPLPGRPSTGPHPGDVSVGEAPLLGERSGTTVVVTGREAYAVDLDRATVRPLATAGILGAVQRGLLVDVEGGVEVWPPPFDGTGATPFTTLTVDQTWVVAGGTQVWVVRLGFGAQRRARLLNQSGSVLLDVPLPPEAWPVGALDRGLVLSTPGATVLLDGQGVAHVLSAGTPFAAAGSAVYVASCSTPEGELVCSYAVVDARGQALDQLVSGEQFAGPVAVGAGPRLAHVVGTGAETALAVDGALVAAVGEAGVQALVWTTDSRWLLAVSGSRLLAIDTYGAGPPVSVEVAPGGMGATGLLLVPS